MALPSPATTWLQRTGFPSRLLETGSNDYERYEEDDERGERRTYHRRFRFPKRIADDEIAAEYTKGILEVCLPVETGATTAGRKIEVQ